MKRWHIVPSAGCSNDSGMRHHLPMLAVVVVLAGCSTMPAANRSGNTNESAQNACAPAHDCLGSSLHSNKRLVDAHLWASRAPRASKNAATSYWLRCATSAYQALENPLPQTSREAAALATRCTDEFLKVALQNPAQRWSSGPAQIGNSDITVEFRHPSPYSGGPIILTRAQDVSVHLFGDKRFAGPGFGVPLAVLAPRCSDRPECKLIPPEGVFRWATAWIETEPTGGFSPPRLVVADPIVTDPPVIGRQRYALATDTSAFYAQGVRTSKLRRLGIWGLLWGKEVGKRAGVYLLEDYDPNKRPLVMIHGLGSSPLAWAKLSNAIWGNRDLRARFQIWHVVYQTNAPLLVTRRRVQGYLDDAWGILDPEGDDPARSGVVLVGHSLGGVVSRMLCVDSGEVLWNSAFTGPPGQLTGDPADLKAIENVFVFKPYPGVSRAIFLAAPHRGSPGADAWFGRLLRALVGRRTPEIQALRRLTRDHPEAVREELRDAYQRADLNSISTLQAAQPVRRAGESLMPATGISYHVISGVLPGRLPETDGAVPLSSTLLSGASSTLVVSSGHNVYDNDQAIAEVLRILRSPDYD
jgi:pimeloyl-ACP methyl ester carboxylesterase